MENEHGEGPVLERFDPVENELSQTQFHALLEDCALLGVRRGAWRSIPTLRIKYESTAAARLTLRLMSQEGRSRTDALLRASVRLGLNYETVRKRLNTWRMIEPRIPCLSWEDSSRI